MNGLNCQPSVHLRRLVLLSICACAVSAHSQSVTWQALPFPTDSDWPGPKGQPAIVTAAEVVLDGRPARTLQTFTRPVRIDCDAVLDARNTTDGAFWMFLIPPGESVNTGSFTNSVYFQLGFSNVGQDVLAIARKHNPSPDTILYSAIYPVIAQTTNHVTLGVAADGQVSLTFNGQSRPVPNTATVSFSQFQIEIEGWQPDAFWHVSHFTVTPEQTTLAISCPTTVTVNADPGQCSASEVNLGSPSTSGNCPGTPTVNNNAPTAFPVGANEVIWTATDACGNSAACTQSVIVVDNQPPVISNLTVTPNVLWPPAHRLVLVAVGYTTTDNCGVAGCELSAVSNEPDNGTGDGGTVNDVQLIPGDAHHVYLRAERSGPGSGRVYTIAVTCTDTSGNVSQRIAEVTVPHDKGKN